MAQILTVLGVLNLFLAGAMVVPGVVSLLHGEDWSVFLKAVLLTAAAGLASFLPAARRRGREISRREAFLIVSLGWLDASFFGSLPFLIAPCFPSAVDALFETVSGFTTTGASILEAIEDLPKGLLFWRSMTQWLGGMGIILFSIAILPFLGVGGMQLFKAEVPGPFVEKLQPRIASTAKILWQTYLLVSALEAALLTFGEMSLYDAVCHTFTTMATGGFSTKSQSIGHFGTYHRLVILFFMLVAGSNFALHWRLLKGQVGGYWRDREFRFYMAMALSSTLLIALDLLWNLRGPLGRRLEEAAFQAVSIMTTTGYATADFARWPPFSQMLLLFLMFVGGCAGSTGGSIKCIRVLILVRYVRQELRKLLHPKAVLTMKFGDQALAPGVVQGVLGMVILYLGIFVLASLALGALGLDLTTALSAVAASLGNVGPGLARVGPAENYAFLPPLAKTILVFCMLAGRLEIYTMIVLIFPDFWRK